MIVPSTLVVLPFLAWLSSSATAAPLSIVQGGPAQDSLPSQASAARPSTATPASNRTAVSISSSLPTPLSNDAGRPSIAQGGPPSLPTAVPVAASNGRPFAGQGDSSSVVFPLLSRSSAASSPALSTSLPTSSSPTRTLSVINTSLPPMPTLPASPPKPFNTANPGATPLFTRPIRPPYGPVADAIDSFFAADADPRSVIAVAASIDEAKKDRARSLMSRAWRMITRRQSLSASSGCLGAGTNDTTINLLFWYGATTVYLCPGVVVPLYNAIYFTAPNQVLITQGAPTGWTRAMLRIVNPDITCAVWANSAATTGVALRNLQIDGNRPGLGFVAGGVALIEMGGNGLNQIIDKCRIFEPRGWSAVHIIEGTNNMCRGMSITNNQIGPAGHAPSGYSQFRRRDSTGEYPGGQWADGVSLACGSSVVSGNTLTDTTDGAIVLFGAPGSMIFNNRIVAADRQLMGGINMVDYFPWNGDYRGVAVYNNAIVSSGAMIKIGIAVGLLSWQTFNQSDVRNFGGSITDNVFSSGSNVNGFFGYAISQSGHNSTTIARNYVKGANFGGLPTNPCEIAPPTPQPFIQCPYTTQGSKFQSSMKPETFNFLICMGPGPLTAKGISVSA